jgi:hypothetical protein
MNESFDTFSGPEGVRFYRGPSERHLVLASGRTVTVTVERGTASVCLGVFNSTDNAKEARDILAAEGIVAGWYIPE